VSSSGTLALAKKDAAGSSKVPAAASFFSEVLRAVYFLFRRRFGAFGGAVTTSGTTPGVGLSSSARDWRWASPKAMR